MLAPLLTVATLLIGAPAVRASPCVAMDINWNLLAFGLGSKDWNAGTQDQWGSGECLFDNVGHMRMSGKFDGVEQARPLTSRRAVARKCRCPSWAECTR